ncbi:hypothetical protein NB724_004270 [Pantoea ananatis]|nr:hypothetical protein [Pantoea ananatis]MCW0337258.1 hypothetical protein [Pantoea ananatis]MCW0385426.1 hypothetical protein [Pantoea ananatis]MCW0410089.1 hypothetical protein [Pantoea ananatis]MCW0430264.1 hypothetical protein [Pantoea ananatis]
MLAGKRQQGGLIRHRVFSRLRQTEHQTAQRDALLVNVEPGRELLRPAGDAAVFKLLPQAQQKIVADILSHLPCTLFSEFR